MNKEVNSPYMHWAKTRMQLPINIGTSGVLHYPLSDLGVSLTDLEISGDSFYGYEPLQKALAAKCNVPENCVVAAIGTSMANHLALASLLDSGDEVLIESPTYGPILDVARYLGANIHRFERKFENGFRIEVAELKKKITSRTKLIVITNLHNPTAIRTDQNILREIGEMANQVGARVLVDEVYLECVHGAQSAFSLGSQFVITGSLTKAYGLSGLRCGWILAEPQLAQRMWRLNDLFGSIPAHSAERLSIIALQKLDQIRTRAEKLLQTNRKIMREFLDTRNDVEFVWPEFGTIVFPRLRSGKVDQLCNILRDEYQTAIVPGSFFELPNHFRLGMGCETDTLLMGLKNLTQALDALKTS
ncbi:MAG: aminotransferase [Acidobacteria bacterium]|nr:MAG: aminotransferase [Acidobacteriota bacterium]